MNAAGFDRPGPGLSPYGGQDAMPPTSCFKQELGTGRTPIHAAAYQGHKDAVTEMLDAGSNFLIKDRDGMTAEFLAKRRNKFECAEALSVANWTYTMESYRKSLQEAKEASCIHAHPHAPPHVPPHAPTHALTTTCTHTNPRAPHHSTPHHRCDCK